MTMTVNIPWKRYALIAELAKRLDAINPQFGKTALQKLVYLLQEVYRIDCGYDFELYSYGPFDSHLLGDLDVVEHWGCVSVNRIKNTIGGYRIRPTDTVDSIRDKATEFLDDEKTRDALADLIATYGAMTARDLELRATSVYVARNLQAKDESTTMKNVCLLVGEIKPKFSEQEIAQAVAELSERKHIAVAA